MSRRMILLLTLSGLVNLFHQPPLWLLTWLTGAFPALEAGEAAYIGWVVAAFSTGLSLIALLIAVVWMERPADLRKFLKLGPVDWPSVGLFLLFAAVLNVLEAAFLRRSLYEPARLLLISVGLWGQPSLDPGFTPDPGMVGFNVLLLLLVFWIEAPEEIFFRGYVQNHLQERIGPAAALLVGAVIWDAWHLSAPAEFVRRLPFALALSLIFRLRQNTTSLAIVHPLGNRLLMLAYVLSPVWPGILRSGA